MKVSRTRSVRGLWDELNQGLFPWTVRVRAPAKVALHLLLGAIVVAVEQMLRMLC